MNKSTEFLDECATARRLPTYSELVAALRYLRQQAGMSDLPANNNALLKTDALLDRIPE